MQGTRSSPSANRPHGKWEGWGWDSGQAHSSEPPCRKKWFQFTWWFYLTGQGKGEGGVSQPPARTPLTEKQHKVELEPRFSGPKPCFTPEGNSSLKLLLLYPNTMISAGLEFRLAIRTLLFLKCCPLQLIWFWSYLWSRCRSLGNSFSAFCVVTSTTSSTEIPFTWAIYSAEMAMFWGSFRTWNRTMQTLVKHDCQEKRSLKTVEKTEENELVKTTDELLLLLGGP